MANFITIDRPDVVALIEEAAKKLTGGNTTEAVALGVCWSRRLDRARCSERMWDRPGFARVSISSHPHSMSNPTPNPIEKAGGALLPAMPRTK